MSVSVVTYSVEGDVGLITVHNPPVNALSRAVRAGLIEAVTRAEADLTVRAMVILCEGRTFIAGADVNEFGGPPQPPHLPEVAETIEKASKPVVAALHGTTLGGGFEIALASHYRIATHTTKIGLPEVKLGLMPGAGGTQRLPRLIGVERTLKMVLSGESIAASDALAWGAIDEVVHGELRTTALAAARRLANSGIAPRRTAALPIEKPNSSVFTEAKSAVAKKGVLIAPGYCLEAVRAATELPFELGVTRERELFLELRASPQAAALRHAFNGEREVTRVPGLPADTATREVRCVAVIGAGTMGGGIAMCFANAGLLVTLLEAEAAALERGMAVIRKTYATGVAKGSLTAHEMAQRLERIRPSLHWDDLREADLIVEAVFEDLEVKRGVFAKMDAVAKPDAILATNTSYLDVAAIAQFTPRPANVVGMHFFSPAHVMRLLENVRASQTAPDVLATVMQVGRTLGKVAVLVCGSDGFVGNRMLAQRTREAFFLLEEGALPHQVDEALVAFGFPMGPFAVGDLAGLDIGWRNRKARAHLRKPGVRDCNLLDKVCEMGRFGQKTGAGWYRYEAGGRAAIRDSEIEQLIIEHSRDHGIERRYISDQEIVEGCVYSMINEGAKILGEGVAARPVDIDMVWLHGYGFPRWRGGPMFFADQLGLPVVYRVIAQCCERFGADFWTPAPLLEERARLGEGFYAHAFAATMMKSSVRHRRRAAPDC